MKVFSKKNTASSLTSLYYETETEYFLKLIKFKTAEERSQAKKDFEVNYHLPRFFEIISKIKILSADDDPLSHKSIKKHLRRHFDLKSLQVAKDGKEAWDYLKTNKYDVLLTDLNMPEMDGYELIQNCFQEEKLSQLMILPISLEDSVASILKIKQMEDPWFHKERRSTQGNRIIFYIRKKSFKDSFIANFFKICISYYWKTIVQSDELLEEIFTPQTSVQSGMIEASQISKSENQTEVELYQTALEYIQFKNSLKEKKEIIKQIAEDATESCVRDSKTLINLLKSNLNEENIELKEYILQNLKEMILVFQGAIEETVGVLAQTLEKEPTYGEKNSKDINKIRRLIINLFLEFPQSLAEERLRNILIYSKVLEVETRNHFLEGLLSIYKDRNKLPPNLIERLPYSILRIICQILTVFVTTDGAKPMQITDSELDALKLRIVSRMDSTHLIEQTKEKRYLTLITNQLIMVKKKLLESEKKKSLNNPQKKFLEIVNQFLDYLSLKG